MPNFFLLTYPPLADENYSLWYNLAGIYNCRQWIIVHLYFLVTVSRPRPKQLISVCSRTWIVSRKFATPSAGPPIIVPMIQCSTEVEMQTVWCCDHVSQHPDEDYEIEKTLDFRLDRTWCWDACELRIRRKRRNFPQDFSISKRGAFRPYKVIQGR